MQTVVQRTHAKQAPATTPAQHVLQTLALHLEAVNVCAISPGWRGAFTACQPCPADQCCVGDGSAADCPSHSTAPQHSIAEDHLHLRGWQSLRACQWRKTNWKKQKKTSQSPLTSVGQMEGMADGMAPSSATQLAKARAPFRACQAKQQRSRTQSCTGAFSRLPGKAATQQNAVLHGLLVLLVRGGSNTLGKRGGHQARLDRKAAERSLARAPCFACQGRQQHTWQARRSSSTTGS